MNFDIGNDIIEVDRIKNLYKKYGDHFTKKIYTDNEIAYCESKGVNKYQSYAARFAAKEAVFKAISSYIQNNRENFSWKDIEILNDKTGKPKATVKKFQHSINISMSHEKAYAIAVAIVCDNG